jgi:hypothetical protein
VCLKDTLLAVGLHNKYPDYFYKPGNLFGTYLGGSGTWVPSKATEPRRVSPEPSPQDSLWDFVGANLSVSEQKRFVDSIARHYRITLTWPPIWTESHTQAFIGSAIPDPDAARYLAELERRGAAGIPLIAPEPPAPQGSTTGDLEAVTEPGATDQEQLDSESRPDWRDQLRALLPDDHPSKGQSGNAQPEVEQDGRTRRQRGSGSSSKRRKFPYRCPSCTRDFWSVAGDVRCHRCPSAVVERLCLECKRSRAIDLSPWCARCGVARDAARTEVGHPREPFGQGRHRARRAPFD